MFPRASQDIHQHNQGYEVTEDEVQMPLDVFKTKYAGPLGYPEYVSQHPSSQPASDPTI